MTPLLALLCRWLPPRVAVLVLAVCYAAVLVLVIFCVTRPGQDFVYL